MPQKICSNCNNGVGVRTILCGCGYHFPSGEMRKDLLAEKAAKQNAPRNVKRGITWTPTRPDDFTGTTERVS